MQSRGINVSGVLTFRKDYRKEVDGNEYARNNLTLFDKRLTHIDHTTRADVKMAVSKKISINELFDSYTVQEKLSTECPLVNGHKCPVEGERHIKFSTRFREVHLNRCVTGYRAIHMSPYIQGKHLKPTYKFYWHTCQNIILFLTPMWKTANILVDRSRYGTQEDFGKAWVDKFNDMFPNGKGLPPYLLGMYRKYNNVSTKTDDSDSDDSDTSSESEQEEEEEEDIETEAAPPEDRDTEYESESENEKEPKSSGIRKTREYYQTEEDKLFTDMKHNPDLQEWLSAPVETVQVNPRSHNFHDWLGEEIVDPRRIDAIFGDMIKQAGKYDTNIYKRESLNEKQGIYHDIVVEYFKAKLEHDLTNGNSPAPEPLRLFAMGYPGSGKSYTVKTILSTLIILCNGKAVNWKNYIRIGCPTGASVSEVGFDSCTVHHLFNVSITETSTEISKKCKDKFSETFGYKVILVLFDEFSMIERKMWTFIYYRLECFGYRERGNKVQNRIGFVFNGDVSQILPVAGPPIFSGRMYNFDSRRRIGKKVKNVCAEGISKFRLEFGMKQLSELPNRDAWDKYCQEPLKNWSTEERKVISEFRSKMFSGTYQAIVLDEVMRKITNDAVADEFTSKHLVDLRFGHAKEENITFLRTHTAKEADLKTDPMKWALRHIILGLHHFQEANPDEVTVDSMNMKAVVECHKLSNLPVYQTEATHVPYKRHKELIKCTRKEFRNLANKITFCKGMRAMLLKNYNPHLGLYNGRRGKYVGPLYSDIEFEVKLTGKQLSESITTGCILQNQINNTGVGILQKYSTIKTVNGKNATEDLLKGLSETETVSITLEPPKNPPSLPQYIIIEFEGYSASGGQAFFAAPHMKDYVPIPLERFSRENMPINCKQQRISFPLEGGDAATVYKCQGATQECNEIRIKSKADIGGVALVAFSRTKQIGNSYVPEGAMPNHMDIRCQRLNPDVIDAECFERELRIKSAVTVRTYMAHNPERFQNRWSEKENEIANEVHACWRNATYENDTVCLVVGVMVEATETEIEEVIRKMIRTEEKLLREQIPALPKEEQEALLLYRNGPKKSKNTSSTRNAKNAVNTPNKVGTTDGKKIPDTESKREKENNRVNSGSRNKAKTRLSFACADEEEERPSTLANRGAVASIINENRQVNNTNTHRQMYQSPGLKNNGSTCYANVVFQLMYRICTMRSAMNALPSKCTGITTLKKLFQEMDRANAVNDRVPFNPLKYHANLAAIFSNDESSQCFNPRRKKGVPTQEQCANHFLADIIDMMEEERMQFGADIFADRNEIPKLPDRNEDDYEMKATQYKEAINDLLEKSGIGYGVSQKVTTYRKCWECNKERSPHIRNDSIINIGLEDRGKEEQSLQNLITDYTKKKIIECPCKENNCGSQYYYEKVIIAGNSEFLIINLKIYKKLPVTNSSGEIVAYQFNRINNRVKIENTVQVNANAYALVGIACHVGELDITQGHYKVYIVENGRYVLYNDHSREITDLNSFTSERGGLEQPYIVMYKKVDTALDRDTTDNRTVWR